MSNTTRRKADEEDDGVALICVGLSVSFLGIVLLLNFLMIPAAVGGAKERQEKLIDTIVQQATDELLAKSSKASLETGPAGVLNIYRQTDKRVVFTTNNHLIMPHTLPPEALSHINEVFQDAEFRSDFEVDVHVHTDEHSNTDYEWFIKQAVAVVDMIDHAGIDVHSYKVLISEGEVEAASHVKFIVGPISNKKGLVLLKK